MMDRQHKSKIENVPVTVALLTRLSGCSHENILKWMDEDNLSLKSKLRNLLFCIFSRKRGKRSGQESWGNQEKQERTLTLRADRIERERSLSEDWTRTEWHLSIIKALCNKLDQLPSRLKSQHGLSDEVKVSHQKMIDDLRTEFVNEIPPEPKI